jgi:2-methylcitrate dehydratase PrpD
MNVAVRKEGRLNERGEALAAFIEGAPNRSFPDEVLNEARRSLVTTLSCVIDDHDGEGVRAARRVVAAWNAPGTAQIFLGHRTAPALAALVNGTAVNSTSYDDAHPSGAGHPGGPSWAAALALVDPNDLSEEKTLAAFLTGFEVLVRLGGGGPKGVGRTLQRRGLHPTSIFGRVAAAAAACVMKDLSREQIANALGLVGTTAGGFIASFGTPAKGWHVGKASMDGILAAEFATVGMTAAKHIYELDGGLLSAFIQGAPQPDVIPPLDFSKWEILNNGYKPYASCRATHPSIQAALTLAEAVKGRSVVKVRATVPPNMLVTEIENPRTPMEAKFSTRFCIALGLQGYRAVPSDFGARTMSDPAIMDVVPRVELEGVEQQPPLTSYLEVHLDSGEVLHARTERALGHPDNPMTWTDLADKFKASAEPVIGKANTAGLFHAARNFGKPGTLMTILGLLEEKSLLQPRQR